MTIASALPFSLIMIVAAFGMWRALIIEGHHHTSLQTDIQSRFSGTSGRGLWRRRLAGLVTHPDQAQVEEFITTTVRKAMFRVQREMDKQGWMAEVHENEAPFRIWLEIIKDEQVDFVYEIRMLEHALPDYAFPEMVHNQETPNTYYRAEVFLRRGGQSYDLYGFDQQDIITDILDQLEKHLHFLHISPASLPWNMAEHDAMLHPSPEPSPGS